MNRLANEASPYLQQHADNPVDWWPWSDEAFAEAARRDVPVLISIGYSACHWCHVMAHESFEDAQVAEVLNSGFLAVKVDREERPDVDAVYMEAVQLVSGSGGWPMTVLALADGRPFWAGTYLPKANFLHLLSQITELWDAGRAAVEADASRLSEAVRHGAELPALAGAPGEGPAGRRSPGPALGSGAGGGFAPEALASAAFALLERYDPEWGGFGNAPKFPQPASLEVLTRYAWRTGDDVALGALRRTLDAMSSGGIYDHLAGGFARYSTDRYWLVPHFEKMLYDNALLVRAYTHAWQLTGAPRYRQVAEETVRYLLNPPLRLAQGAWASAEDADSEGTEGRFYTWSMTELVAIGGPAVAEYYGARSEGNWDGKNILWRPGRGVLERPPQIEQARQDLLEHRSHRARPGLDGKVLTEWNAMAISALAYAGSAFGQSAWVNAASETGELLLHELRRADGRWQRSWRPAAGDNPDATGGARHLAYATDYAWLVDAFTRLGEATGRSFWTSAARETAEGLIELFWDHEGGGFFTYGSDAPALIARMKDIYDGAVPSANSTAALALARLGELTGETSYTETATRTVEVTGPARSRAAAAFPGLALAADYLASPRRQVVVSSTDVTLVRPVWQRYLPETVLAWGEPYPSPLWEGRVGAGTAGRAFVCEGYSCKLPVTGAAELAAILDPRPQRTGA